MPTLTSTAYARAPRAVHAGVNSQTIEFTSSAAVEASATTILMAKIPAGATILDVFGHHTSAAVTCPTDVGIGAAVSAFISQGTKGAMTRAAVVNNIPYLVSVADNATDRFLDFKVTPTPAAGGNIYTAKYTVLYTMDA